MSNAHYSHFRSRADQDLSALLMTEAGLSDVRVQRLLEFGAVYINGERVRAEHTVKTDDIVRVHFRPKRFQVPSSIEVVMHDSDFVVIDKPGGLPTHPTLDNYIENAWYLMQQQLNRPLYVTHRLDIGTQGLLILATSPRAQSAINKQFEERRVKKVYRALTDSPVPLGRHEHFMELDPQPPKPVLVQPSATSCSAILTVRKTWELGDVFACELELETGRTHQVRAQLSYLGCPIIGDAVYGSTRKYVHERLALECFHISFAHRSQTIGLYRPTSLASPHPTTNDIQMSTLV